ncbi:MAG: oligoendopeptidase F family protein [Spirochaetia bacterium]|nr:oligoendopeptidase F family protein [Spirochaetia bacterium]
MNAGGERERERKKEQEHRESRESRESRETAVPVREQVNPQHCWNTADIYPDSKAWFRDHDRLKAALKQLSAYRTTLGDSPRQLLSGLESWFFLHQLLEKLEVFAFLNRAADGGCRENQQIDDQIRITSAEVEQAAGFFEPEILDLDPGYIAAAFQQEPGLLPYKRTIDTIIRRKPHILTEREENLTALWDGTRITRKAFTELVTADLDFGMIEVPIESQYNPRQQGCPVKHMPLTRANLSRFLIHPDREVRRQAYLRTYNVYDQHKHTLAALYEGSIRRDIVSARTRKYTCCREMALFPDAVPEKVYDSLIGAVRKRLPEFHDFFRMRKNQLGVSILRPYDLSVPLVPQPEISFSYEQAVDLIIESLRIFPTPYTDMLRKGLLAGWVDRYENRGKQAGAFTAGYYGSGSEKDGGSLVHPYILVNYKPEVLRNLFTLAHESGHAMHTWYSIKNNHFSCYQYSILEAETAANVHEFLLYRHLIAQAQDLSQKAFFLERQLGDLIAKLLRQTMLAEFEHMVHREAEEDRPITTEVFRNTFRDLAADYYGPEVIPEVVSDLEGLTIPHLYTRYYVYTYPLGASAALAAVEAIAGGEGAAADRYLEFLKSGGSRDPVDALRMAGVDILDSFTLEKALDYTVRLMRDYRQLR